MPSEHIEAVIERFEEMGYLNDARVAKRMAEGLVRKSWGPRQLRAKLYDRGFDGEQIDAAIESLDEETSWVEVARARVERKFRKEAGELDDDEQEKGVSAPGLSGVLGGCGAASAVRLVSAFHVKRAHGLGA